MSQILVSGLVNLEVTLRVERFPIDYFPVRYPFHGIGVTVSGVGFNVAKALTRLGNQVTFLSLIGDEPVGELARSTLRSEGISDTLVLGRLAETAQSVILYDNEGRRQINVDLKDVQEQTYPEELALPALEGCAMAALCNVNFSRPLLSMARAASVPIATDVHAIAELDHPYDRDFMAAADVLFMSHERLPCPPEEWARRVYDRYGTKVIVIGLGAEGALLHVARDGLLERIPAHTTREVVSTIGAGDALFAAFIDGYARGLPPKAALERASLYASYKIGEAGAAEGLLDADGLDELVACQ
ncbi:MAG: carbohydrate kinase family protein [Myxococcales bacterium]|jgi:sugar/nucleoside kinase (ribokinase family)